MPHCEAQRCREGREPCNRSVCGFALHRIPIEDKPPITQEDAAGWLEVVLIVSFIGMLAWFVYTAVPVLAGVNWGFR